MLDKIFNRKYIKTLKEIDEEITELKAKEKATLDKIWKSKTLDEYREIIAWSEVYRHRREVLEILRGNLITYIG
jgi:hypothetical protein